VLDPSLRAPRSAQHGPVTPGRRAAINPSSEQPQSAGDPLATPRRSETTSDGASDSDAETATPSGSKHKKGQQVESDKADHGLVEGAMRGTSQWSEFLISR
jgi:hypothetical protein